MKKILVCEDEAAIRDFVVINLTRAGYDVVEADCGETALAKYDEYNGDFDIAILDVMMPGINGFEVCKELRNRNGGIGIIMLSALPQSGACPVQKREQLQGRAQERRIYPQSAQPRASQERKND